MRVAQRQLLPDQRCRVRLVHPLRKVEAQHARGLGVVGEEPAVRDRLERAFALHGHRHAGGGDELRVRRRTSPPPARAGSGRPPGPAAAPPAPSASRRRAPCASPSAPAAAPPRRGTPNGAAPRPRAAGPNVICPTDARHHGDRVEHPGLREAADELVLQTDAERHHAGERRDADRHAERRQRGPQLRLARLRSARSSVSRKVTRGTAASSPTTAPSSMRDRAVRVLPRRGRDRA